MGTPLPDNEPTTGCALCFGSARPLGVVQPKYVTLNFSGIKPGFSFEDPAFLPHGDYRLQQVTGCFYRLIVSGSHSVELDWTLTVTRVIFTMISFPAAVWTTPVGVLCATELGESAISTPTRVVWGGTIKITWSTQGLE